MTATLVHERHGELTLEEAIGQACGPAGLAGAVGIVSWPDRCRVVLLDASGRVSHPRSPDLSLSGAFEARFFAGRRELRWRMARRSGRAVLVSEGDGAGIAGWEASRPVEVEPLRQTYLLFGMADGQPADGWLRLSEGRMPSFDVPLPVNARRVLLHAVEYVLVDHEHGNCWVCEERLVGLGPAPDST